MRSRFVVIALIVAVVGCAPPGQKQYEVFGTADTKGATVLLDGHTLGVFERRMGSGPNYSVEGFGPQHVDSVVVLFPDGRRIAAATKEPFEYVWVSHGRIHPF